MHYCRSFDNSQNSLSGCSRVVVVECLEVLDLAYIFYEVLGVQAPSLAIQPTHDDLFAKSSDRCCLIVQFLILRGSDGKSRFSRLFTIFGNLQTRLSDVVVTLVSHWRRAFSLCPSHVIQSDNVSDACVYNQPIRAAETHEREEQTWPRWEWSNWPERCFHQGRFSVIYI